MGSLFGNVVRAVVRSPALKLVPGLGTVATAASVLSMIPMGGNKSPGLLPQMPGMPGKGGVSPYAGDRGIFQNDPNVPEWMKPAAISKTNLKVCYRAPKGYVIRYDEAGDPYGIPRDLAKKYLGWKPAKKPLLSIRDTNAIRRAGSAIKKLQNAEKMAKKIANWKSPAKGKTVYITGGPVGKGK